VKNAPELLPRKTRATTNLQLCMEAIIIAAASRTFKVALLYRLTDYYCR